MKKDVHVYIDYELSNIIDKISKTNKMTLSNTYNVLLKSGLTISDIKNIIINLCFKRNILFQKLNIIN